MNHKMDFVIISQHLKTSEIKLSFKNDPADERMMTLNFNSSSLKVSLYV